MITDIPQEKDFKKMAISLLNVAWETALKLALSIDEAQNELVDVEEEEKYWEACQTELATSISLAQQASEFFLKARIASVSPFLLISGSAEKWPKGCDTADMPFADFHTVDAHDLIRMHDAVLPSRLSQAIKDLFGEMRRKRNTIIHTVDKRLKIEVEEVVVAILEITSYFIGSKKWIDTRRQHLHESSNSIAYDSDGVTYSLVAEFTWVVEMLKPTQVLNFFGFNKKQRKYICPSCWLECRDADLEPKIAFLSPNEPESTSLHCFICDNDHAVIREDCIEPDCRGNVLDAEDRRCLTCSAPNDLSSS